MAVVITASANRNDRGRVLIFFVLGLASILFMVGIGLITYALLAKMKETWVWVGVAIAAIGVLAYVIGGMMIYGYTRVPHYTGHVIGRAPDSDSKKHEHHGKKHKCCGHKSRRQEEKDYMDDRKPGRNMDKVEYFQQPLVQISSENVQIMDSQGNFEGDDSVTGNSDLDVTVQLRSPSTAGQAYASYESLNSTSRP